MLIRISIFNYLTNSYIHDNICDEDLRTFIANKHEINEMNLSTLNIDNIEL